LIHSDRTDDIPYLCNDVTQQNMAWLTSKINGKDLLEFWHNSVELTGERMLYSLRGDYFIARL
ncbi:MAG: hypothetical protein LBE28_08145, partial [Providencia alcalifaciens]|nr:hypothetical protein [Providencia alcalifaciens]